MTLACQKEVIEQIKLIDNIFSYKGSDVYCFKEPEAQFNFTGGNYKRCIIPYDDCPLIEYY